MDKIKDFIKGFFDYVTKNPKQAAINFFIVIFAVYGVYFIYKSILFLFKVRNIKKVEKNMTLLKIKVRDSANIKDTEDLIKNIHSTLLNTKTRVLFKGQPFVSFEIGATKDNITFYIKIPAGYKSFIIERIYSTYPDCGIEETDEYLPDLVKKSKKDKKYIYGTELEYVYHHIFPLRRKVERGDILDSILSALKKLQFHETACVQILSIPRNSSWQSKGRKILSRYENKGSRPDREGKFGFSKSDISEQIKKLIDHEMEDYRPKKPTQRKTKLDRKEITGATDKITGVGFETIIRIVVLGGNKVSCKTRVKAISAAFSELDLENKLKRRSFYFRKKLYENLKNRRVYILPRNNIMSPAELSSFFMRLPAYNKVIEEPRLEAMQVKEFIPPEPIKNNEDSIILGKNIYRGEESLVRIALKDLFRHISGGGASGVGKSKWLQTIMYQLADKGLGFALIEPHGELSNEMLGMIPEHRRKDVVIFDILSDFPTPFNFCKIRDKKNYDGYDKEKIIEKAKVDLLTIMKRKFSDSWSERNAHFLGNIIETVMRLNNGNFVDSRRLLSDSQYRKETIAKIKEPQLLHFWKTYFTENDKGQLDSATESTAKSLDYKISNLLSKVLVRSVGQDECIDFGDILDNNKILIFKLDKEKMGLDQVSFLGAIAIRLLMIEAYRRNKSQRHKPFMLVIDEAQNFLTPDLSEMLAEMRKFGLGVCSFNQELSQYDKIPGLRDTVFGANVGTKVIFRASKNDSRYYSNELFDNKVKSEDIFMLPDRHTYTRISRGKKVTDVFNMSTVDAPNVSKEEASKCITEIIIKNRENKKRVDEIDREIAKRMGMAYFAGDTRADNRFNKIPDNQQQVKPKIEILDKKNENQASKVDETDTAAYKRWLQMRGK